MLPTVSPHRSPLEVAEQGADQLPDAALTGGHHALQAHHEVPAVLGVEHHQLVLPRGHAHSCHLGQRQREREREDTQLNTQINKYTEKHKHTGGKKAGMCVKQYITSPSALWINTNTAHTQTEMHIRSFESVHPKGEEFTGAAAPEYNSSCLTSTGSKGRSPEEFCEFSRTLVLL